MKQLFDMAAGPLPLTSAQFTTGGGTLIVLASGSGFTNSGNALLSMDVKLDGNTVGQSKVRSISPTEHLAYVPNFIVVPGVAGGAHTITLTLSSGATDIYDVFTVTVIEFPF